jgi:hypothetical protein
VFAGAPTCANKKVHYTRAFNCLYEERPTAGLQICNFECRVGPHQSDRECNDLDWLGDGVFLGIVGFQIGEARAIKGTPESTCSGTAASGRHRKRVIWHSLDIF